MKRYLAWMLLLFMLSACAPVSEGPVIIPPWYAPVQDFTLECKGSPLYGECNAVNWGSGGDL